MTSSRQEMAKKFKEICDELGLVITIEGCGCCSSPCVRVDYKGERIVFGKESPDCEYFNFDSQVEGGLK